MTVVKFGIETATLYYSYWAANIKGADRTMQMLILAFFVPKNRFCVDEAHVEAVLDTNAHECFIKIW